MRFLSGSRYALLLIPALASLFVPGIAWAGSAPAASALLDLEPADRHFERYEIGERLVYFHERVVGGALVEGDFINYQFDALTGELVSSKTHWREDVPEMLPPARVNREEAEAKALATVGGQPAQVTSSRLMIISPESAVFPIRPAPQNPCWVVWTAEGEGVAIFVIDAVTGEILGRGVPPPYTGLAFTGPWECPGSGDWRAWSQNAEAWFEAMGYDTEGLVGPTLEQIRSHVKSDHTAVFHEIAHGGSESFNFACIDGAWQSLAAFKVGVWIGAYAKMPFTFLGSCDGMCVLDQGRFSYEFRKGSSEKTVTVGYCGMSTGACETCWYWSWDWQDAMYNYMSLGWTVKAAFDQANADYPTCWTNACMRFAGDETFAVVPVVARDPEPPAVTVISPDGGETLEYGTQYEIRWAAADNARVTSVVLLLSTDGGATYPDTIAAGEANDSSYLWTVPDLTTQTARIRVVALDGVPNEGADVSDADFTLWGTAAGVGGARYSGLPDGVVLEVAGANPARSGWRLIYGLPAGSDVRLAVYDVGGRLVRRLAEGRRGGGYYQVDWDPAASDAPVGPGVYFLRLDCDAGAATAKAVVAR
ncbi:MAG: hypothetical protein WAW06_05245 [bacterium]